MRCLFASSIAVVVRLIGFVIGILARDKTRRGG